MLLRNVRVTDAELGIVGNAFERAWDNCLKAGLVTRQNLLEMRELVAARILRCAYYGERDEWRLARDALVYIHELGASETFTYSRRGDRGAYTAGPP